MVLMTIAVMLALCACYLCHEADWHWSVALAAACVPVGFTYFLGLLGLIIGALFIGSMWRASAVIY